MFWPLTERASQGKPEFGRMPWFTIGLMATLFLVFVWTRIGLSAADQRVEQAREALSCYYLTHDYTRIPSKHRDLFSPRVLAHAQRAELAVQAYLTDALVQKKAQALSGSGEEGTDEWRQDMAARPKGQSCLTYALRRRFLSRSPNARVYVSMARLYQASPSKYQQEQDQLVAHVQRILDAEQAHPLTGWGLRPAVNGAETILTAPWIQPNVFSLLWLLLLLWPIGKMLEDQWRYPIWGVWWLASALLCNGVLWVVLSSSKGLILGAHGAFAGVFALWMIVYGGETVRWALWLPKQTEHRVFAFQGYYLIVVWFVLQLLDTLLLQRASPIVFLIHVLSFGLFAGATYFLQQHRWLEVVLGEPMAPTETEIAQQTWRTEGQIKQIQEQHRQKQLKHAEALERSSRWKEAAQIYKELMQMGQPTLELLTFFISTREKSGEPATVEEYLQAARLALFEQKYAQMKDLYLRMRVAHDIKQLSQREHVALAGELKRAGWLLEAAEEADAASEKGQDSPLFMKALIIRAESLLEHGEDPEAAMRVFYQAKNFLPSFSDFEEAVVKGMQKAQAAVDAEQMGPPVLPSSELEPATPAFGSTGTGPNTVSGTSAGLNAISGTSAGLNAISGTSAGFNTLRMQGLPRSAAKVPVATAKTSSSTAKAPPSTTPIPQGPPGAIPQGPPGAVPRSAASDLPPDYVQPPPGLDGEEALFGRGFDDPYKELNEAPASGASWEEIPSLLLARASEYAGKSGFVKEDDAKLEQAAEALKEKVDTLKQVDEAWLSDEAKPSQNKVFFGGAAADPKRNPSMGGFSLAPKPSVSPLASSPSPVPPRSVPVASSPAPVASSPAPAVSTSAPAVSTSTPAAKSPTTSPKKSDGWDSWSDDALPASESVAPVQPTPQAAPEASHFFSTDLFSQDAIPAATSLAPLTFEESSFVSYPPMQGEVLSHGDVAVDLFGDLTPEIEEAHRLANESASSDVLFSVLDGGAFEVGDVGGEVLQGEVLQGEVLPFAASPALFGGSFAHEQPLLGGSSVLGERPPLGGPLLGGASDSPQPSLLSLSFQKPLPRKEGESLFARLRPQDDKDEKK